MNKGQFQKGHKGYWVGKQRSQVTKELMSLSHKKRYINGAISFFVGKSAWNKGIKTGIIPCSAFKKGFTPWNKGNRLFTKEMKRLVQQRAEHNRRHPNAGKLGKKTIQQIYEDNIKQYGTLTCYLCLKPIEFGKDSLEHKTPLIRGGTNEYNNLAIAHRSCNSKKHAKTEEEYRNLLTLAGIK
jgi:5-methylcytosine-specific restriction endonuclease McrA